MPLAIRIHPQDNVAVVLEPIRAGDLVHVAPGTKRTTLCSAAAIGFGHKVALRDIPSGHPVIKFGQRIGRSTADMRCGDHVHIEKLSGFPSGETAATP